MTKQPKTLSTNQGEFVIYTTEDDKTEIHLKLVEETVWMTQAEMAMISEAVFPVRRPLDWDLPRIDMIDVWLIIRRPSVNT